VTHNLLIRRGFAFSLFHSSYQITCTLAWISAKIPPANATPVLKPEQGIALVASASTNPETELVFSNLVIAVP
jgi:hypothetical protein